MTRRHSQHSWDELAGLFERASALNPTERSRLLDEACAGRPGLRAEVEAMLEVAGTEGALELESLADTRDATVAPPGTVIGGWRLRGLIARGGMGEVHLADRTAGDFEQRAAVKLLRTRWPTDDLLERFRRERELLARLTHPSVVPMLDGGTSPDGRPYIVLQYVDGLPITDYCDQQQLDLRARMRLFVDLCRAVQAAHSNLVVHRDLKPSNILVTPEGEIRLLDFGIAKLLDPEPSDVELTLAAPAPMTPGRAAPEQRSGNVASTATDVWALGLLLHEMATGEPPPDLERESAGPAESFPDPDLAAIVSVALRTEPERRYPSAGQMGDDVDRWLAGQPVSARPDSFAYRASRFVSRHRIAVAIAAVAAVGLLTLSLVATVQSLRARDERNRAAAEAAKAGAVVDLLISILGGTDPTEGAAGDSVRIDDLLARGEDRARSLGAQPEVQAAVYHALGKILLERGAYARARAMLESTRDNEIRRLGESAPELAPLRLDYARVLHMAGDLDGAIAEVTAAHAALADGPMRPLVEARVLLELGALTRGEPGAEMLERAILLLRSTPGADPLDLGGALVAMAMRTRESDPERARALFTEALAIERPALGDDHPTTLALRSNLASTVPDPEERAREHREILAARITRLGEGHPHVGNSWNYLGVALAELGRFDEAEQALERGRAIWVDRAGPATGQALLALRELARIDARRGRFESAAARYAELVHLLPSSRIDEVSRESYRNEALAFAESPSGVSNGGGAGGAARRRPMSAAPPTPSR